MIGLLTRLATDINLGSTPAQPTSTAANIATAIVLGILGVLCIGLAVVSLMGLWRMYQKAGYSGWASLVPLYNLWVLAEISGKPGWWGFYPLLGLIPFVGWVGVLAVGLIIALGLAHNFGKSDAFGIFGLWLFSFVGYLVLGFGSATYRPVNGQTPMQPTQPMPPVMPTPPAPIQ